MPMAERKSNIRLTKGTPYLALTCELWGVFCEDFEKNWLRYNGIALYHEAVELFTQAAFQEFVWSSNMSYAITVSGPSILFSK